MILPASSHEPADAPSEHDNPFDALILNPGPMRVADLALQAAPKGWIALAPFLGTASGPLNIFHTPDRIYTLLLSSILRNTRFSISEPIEDEFDHQRASVPATLSWDGFSTPATLRMVRAFRSDPESSATSTGRWFLESVEGLETSCRETWL